MATSTALESLVGVLVQLRDGIGVLSLYVGMDPSAETTPRPPWEITLDDELGSLRRTLREEAPRKHWATLDRRLRELRPQLSHLVDTSQHGRGRALFAAIESGETHSIAVQAALPTRARLGDVAHVIPLLAVDEGAPMGLVVVGRDSVRALEARLGEIAEVASFDVEPVVGDGPERKGPSRPNPMRAQHMIAQRDRYARHVEAGHSRLLGRAADAVSRLAVERGWLLAAVAADARGGRPLAGALAAAGIEVERVDRDLVELRSTLVFAELAPVVAAARRRRDLSLVQRARHGALSGGRGALGLADTLAALAEGRIDRLLIDGERDLAGWVGPEGELLPLDAAGRRPERLFPDRIVIGAIESGSEVVVVGGRAAAELADVDGIAALLRW